MKIICRQSPPMEITKVRDAPTGIDHLGNLFRGIVLLGANRSESNVRFRKYIPPPKIDPFGNLFRGIVLLFFF